MGVSIVLSTHFLLLHILALSESLFLFLTLCGLICFFNYIENRTIGNIIKAGVFFSLTALCRYAGVSWILAGALAVFLRGDKTPSLHLKHSLVFLLLSSSGLLLWWLYSTIIGAPMAGRTLGFNMPTLPKLAKLVQTIMWWLMFEINMSPAGYVRFFSFLGLFFFIIKQDFKLSNFYRVMARDPRRKSLLLFVLLYLSIVTLSLLFFDPAIPLDYRLLSPLFVILLVFFSRAFSIKRNLIYGLLLMAWLSSSTIHCLEWGNDISRFARWNEYQRFNLGKSEDFLYLKGFPPEALVYTNDPELFYCLSGHPPALLNISALKGMEARPDTSKERVSLVFFKQKRPKTFLPRLQDLRELPGTTVVRDSEHLLVLEKI